MSARWERSSFFQKTMNVQTENGENMHAKMIKKVMDLK